MQRNCNRFHKVAEAKTGYGHPLQHPADAEGKQHVGAAVGPKGSAVV
jgi:hypothetical protein